MAGALQGVNVGSTISQYTLYLAMFCPLHSNISKEQHESISAIHLANTENSKSKLMKCAPHISIRESHNTSISVIYNIVSKA